MRRSPRNVTIAFDHAGLTPYGGAFFLHEFARVLQIRHFLARHLKWDRRNCDYGQSQMILALAWPLILGLDRCPASPIRRRFGVSCSTHLPLLRSNFAAPTIDCCNS